MTLNNILSLSRLIAIFCLLGCAAINPKAAIKTWPRPSSWDDIKHVVVVIFENASPVQTLAQPYFQHLTAQGAFFYNYQAITHPSQPNYIAMIAGSTHNVTSDHIVDLDEQHIGGLLERAGKTWKVYAEDYPGNCFLGAKHGLYVRKHVPFLSFKNVQSEPSRCNNIVEAINFVPDLSNDRLPTFSLYIPNVNNDGHDTGLSFANDWLKNSFGAILDNQTLTKNTLFVITFDEDDRLHLNRIYAVFLGAGVKPGASSEVPYNHYSLLRTIEEIFQLGDLGAEDAKAKIIQDIWQ